MSDAIICMKTRRSIRNYDSGPVEQEKINQIIEAGLYAPSGKNRQNTVILQIRDQALHDEIVRRNCAIGGWQEGFDPFYNAPDILVVLAKKEDPTCVYDGALVMGNLMLAAHALGVGSCWIHRAKEEFDTDWGRDLIASLGLEGEYEGIGHVALGYPADDLPAAAPRKSGRVYSI